MKLAMGMCIRNEERFLKENLEFHRRLGVSAAYVFLDACGDRSKEIAHSFDHTRVMTLDPKERVLFSEIDDLHACCMNYALEMAKIEGYDWLLWIDPDEFAFAENESHYSGEISTLQAGNLLNMLSDVESSVDQIILTSREGIPVGAEDGLQFAEQAYFLGQADLNRSLDLSLGWPVKYSDPLFNSAGKSIVRTSSQIQALNSYRWVIDQNLRYPDLPDNKPPNTITMGRIYHFPVDSKQHLKEKLQKPYRTTNLTRQNASALYIRRLCSEFFEKSIDRSYIDLFWNSISMSRDDLNYKAKCGELLESNVVKDVLSFNLHRDDHSNQVVKPVRAQPSEWINLLKSNYSYRLYGREPEWLKGFYAVEVSEGKGFRWTLPKFGVRLLVCPGTYNVSLVLNQLIGFWQGKMKTTLNEREISDKQVVYDEEAISFKLSPKDFSTGKAHWLFVQVDSIDTSQWEVSDRRSLGLPLFEIIVQKS